MGTKKLHVLACLSLGLSFSANAQITNAVTADTYLGNYGIQNSGLAIAPNIDVHAAVYDDGNILHVNWIDGPTGAVIDNDIWKGVDPDVAYFSDQSALAVVYEYYGKIIVHEYQLTTVFPVDYSLVAQQSIDYGTYPNIDMNSNGRGIISWEDAGVVKVCAYTLFPFTPGPIVAVSGGIQPDVVLMDDGVTVALTYVDQSSGKLIIETSDYSAIQTGTYSLFNQWTYAPMSFYERPRVASERNMCCGLADDFGVVAQDFNGSTAEVLGFFGNGAVITNPLVQINVDYLGCSTLDPRPVIAYDRDIIRIAWSQQYPGCTSLSQTAPNPEDDVIMVNHKLNGNPLGWNYEEVNQYQSSFGGNSKTSIATEYDGFGYIIDATFKLSLVYNDGANDVFWKTKNAVIPNFMEDGITSDRGDNFSLVTSPVDQTIEVVSASDDAATFQLMDYAGRLVDLKTISTDGNLYSIDISHLSGGMYFLNCTSAAGEQVLRILQVSE